MLILSTGLYALPLSALAGSYTIMPPGGGLPPGGVADLIVQAVGASFGLALRLAAPFLLAGIVWQAALGLLARLVPQLQVYTAAAPGQILGGVVLLGLLATRVTGAWSQSIASS